MNVLVAGIGNVFQRDDAFGVEVVRRLAAEPLPDCVTVKDIGIRGVHLAFDLLDDYDAVVLIDACARGKAAGSVSVIEPEIDGVVSQGDAHQMDPVTMLRFAGTLGAKRANVFLVACEPADISDGMGLTDAVARAVEPAVGVVRDLLDMLIAGARTAREEGSTC